MELEKLVRDNLDKIKEMRMKFHEIPEPAYNEFKTQGMIMKFLDEIGLEYKKMFNTGLVSLMNDEESCIAVRTDMDAIPLGEGKASHLCGHDYHMAVALGTALVLKKAGFKRTVKFIFQPAEEATGGAEKMIEEGVLDDPKVEVLIGYHVWPGTELGTVEAAEGPSMGSVDDFYITFRGKGGHAAMPHLCKNPLYPAINFIQTVNDRLRTDIDPLNSCVVTFSSINAGNVPNVIADECKVMGTARTFDEKLRCEIHDIIVKTAELCALKYDVKVTKKYSFQYPPLINDRDVTEKFIKSASSRIGRENVVKLIKTFAAEDFSFFAKKVPSVHYRLGIYDGEKGDKPLHSSDFSAAEESLYYGVLLTAGFVMDYYDC